MKRGWAASFLVSAVIALAMWTNIAESRATPDTGAIKLCYANVDVRPWHYRRGGGLDFQLLDRVGNRAGVSFQYEAMSWPACLERLRARQVDGAFGEDFAAQEDIREFASANRLHAEGESTTYLVLTPDLAERRPEVAKRIRESIETVRASAAYLVLERQTLNIRGKA